MHAKYQLTTTHEYLLYYAVEYKTEKLITSHHNIDTIILGMKIPGKPKMGKPVQQSNIDFIMRKYGTFTITTNSPKPGECSTQHNH